MDVKGGKIAVGECGLYKLSASRRTSREGNEFGVRGRREARRVTPCDSQHLGSGSLIIKVPRRECGKNGSFYTALPDLPRTRSIIFAKVNSVAAFRDIITRSTS